MVCSAKRCWILSSGNTLEAPLPPVPLQPAGLEWLHSPLLDSVYGLRQFNKLHPANFGLGLPSSSQCPRDQHVWLSYGRRSVRRDAPECCVKLTCLTTVK